MKKYVLLLGVALFVLAGCVAPNIPGMTGSLHTKTVSPGYVGDSSVSSEKVGTAICKGLLGVAWGDCSIDAAMKEAGITKVNHVDYDSFNVLFIYGELKVKVYGE